MKTEVFLHKKERIHTATLVGLRPSTREWQSAVFSKISTLRSLFKNLAFGAQNRRLLFTCGRKATTERKKKSLCFHKYPDACRRSLHNLLCMKHLMMSLFLQFSTESEQYLVAWDRKGMPKDIDRLNNLTVLFTVSVLLELWSFRPEVDLPEGVWPSLREQTSFSAVVG